MGESLQGSRLQIVREVLIETGEANNMTNFKVYEEKRNPSGVRLVLSHGTDGQETQRRERHLVNCWRADTSKKKDHLGLLVRSLIMENIWRRIHIVKQ